MKIVSLLIMVCGYVTIFLSPAAAQTDGNGNEAYQSALAVYHRFLHPETGLYKGNEYIDYARTIQEGTPFFDPVPFKSGSVVYHHILYENVSIAYDIVKDEVVIFDAPHLYKLSLINSDVSRFTTSDHTFVRLTKDSTNSSRIRTGFYDVLYEGKTRLLKKETRNIQESLSNTEVRRYIISLVTYFAEKDGVYYTVTGKSSLLSVLSDKKKELQQFIRRKKLKFRKDKDNSLAQATAYYDTITK